MTRLNIQPWEVAALLEKVRFKQRKCSDGQCCSFDLHDPFLPKGVSHMYYWIIRYRKKLHMYVSYSLRTVCPKLHVDFEEEKGILYIGTSCTIYLDRPKQCYDFGINFGINIKCNYAEYVENAKQKYHSLFLLVLKKDKFLDSCPFLNNFSLASKYPQLDDSLMGIHLSKGIYVPMPADEKMLP